MGFFSKIKDGLRKTKESMVKKMQKVVNSFTKIDEELFEQLEETMIMSDMGVETSVQICEELRKRIKEQGITDPSVIMDMIQEIVFEMMGEDIGLDLSKAPSVIMVIGVNGAGKTTTIGKLCHTMKNEGKKVIVAAAVPRLLISLKSGRSARERSLSSMLRARILPRLFLTELQPQRQGAATYLYAIQQGDFIIRKI